MRLEEKISIIIPCYGTEEYVGRCLESVITQTYKNLEIIVVNDASPNGMEKILAKYAEKDKRIKIINHEKNRGLFQARVSGSKIATGNYIAFLDSDDYVDLDYYRELLFTIIDKNADMVISNTVVEEENRKYVYNFFKTKGGNSILENEKILFEYFNQKGLNYRWHTVWNKLYSMNLWKKCEKFYEDLNTHLIMTEDFVFSTVIYSNAKKMVYNDRANYFYCTNDAASTSLNKLTYKKCNKNISDIKTSFDYIENYLKKIKIYNKYKKEFISWKALYTKMWYDNIKNALFSKEEEELLLSELYKIDKTFLENKYDNKDNFYQVITTWNDKLIELKEKILVNEIISFDVFDTLIVRPLLEPKDMFILLNLKFNEIFQSNGLLEFSKIREEAEANLRKKIKREKNYEEITIDEIYEFISKEYDLDLEKLNLIKIEETRLEINICSKRETLYSIYELCRYLNKKVVATTDMYLPRETIERILEINGYEYFDRIYISSEEKITKGTGNLFKHLVVEQKINPKKILHIGDNIHSDYNIPKSLRINAFYCPKTTDIFNNYSWKENNVNYCGRLYENFQMLNIDHENYTTFLGNRCAMGLIANKYFDNPFISFNSDSDFNCDPYFIGYYALGMHMLAVSFWLLKHTEKNNYDSISFMARDGYLPYQSFQKICECLNKKIKLNYIHVSRKALMPLTLKNFKDFYKIQDYIQLDKVNVKDILDNLKYIITLPENYVDILKDNNLSIDSNFEDKNNYYILIETIYKHFYDKEKYDNYLTVSKKYFNENFVGKSAVFDIGYSAKPELLISDIIGKKIDTYFIHVNNDTAYKNSIYSDIELNSFYQYKPTFTGTLREYLISSIEPSCIGYNYINNAILPELEKNYEKDYFNLKILEEIQEGSLNFIDDFIKYFKDYFNIIEINSYYMSIPFEYYLHYSKPTDRMIFKGLNFEQNVSENINILEFWESRINEYNSKNNMYGNHNKNIGLNNNEYRYNDFLNERVKCRNRFIKILFYILYDRVALRYKIANKLEKNVIIYKIAQKIYRALKRNK